MRKSAIGLIVVGAAATLAVSACSSSKKSTTTSSAPAGGSTTSSSGTGGAVDGKGAKVGIIMPDRQSSNRWISSDPDALAAQCKKDNLVCDIQNADNSATNMTTIAQTMMNNGVKVLMIVNLDSASASKIEESAKAKNIVTIDYDRLTLGGSASLYVSFDNTKVGDLQGQTLVNCPEVKGKSAIKYVDVNGSPTDNNATLFKQGYDGVLAKQPGWTKVADQSIDKWDNQQAGVTFATMLNKTPDLNAVMVANDGMAGPVVSDLTKQKLNGKVAVSGQDASVEGLQRIMTGDQCFTIYKPSTGEAVPAVDAAAQLATGGAPNTTQTVEDPQTKRQVPAILATPIAITIENVAQPINDGYTPKAQTCAGSFAALCTKAGVK